FPAREGLAFCDRRRVARFVFHGGACRNGHPGPEPSRLGGLLDGSCPGDQAAIGYAGFHLSHTSAVHSTRRRASARLENEGTASAAIRSGGCRGLAARAAVSAVRSD